MNSYTAFAIKSYISSFQRGFLKAKSTLPRFKVFSSGSHTDVIYTDFSKAFDFVGHKLLASGLLLYLLKSIRSYLQNTSFKVLFSSITFDQLPVTSGVHQGWL